jgi:hypothetical protein
MKYPDFYRMTFLPASSRKDASTRWKNGEELPDAARRVTTASNGFKAVGQQGNANMAPVWTTVTDQHREFHQAPHPTVVEYPFMSGLYPVGPSYLQMALTCPPQLAMVDRALARNNFDQSVGQATAVPSYLQMAPTRLPRLAMVDRALDCNHFEVTSGLDAAHWDVIAQRKLQHRLLAQRQGEILLALQFGAI